LQKLIKSQIEGKEYQFLRERPPIHTVPQAGRKASLNRRRARRNEASRLEGESFFRVRDYEIRVAASFENAIILSWKTQLQMLLQT
jgi:hypothetical protein